MDIVSLSPEILEARRHHIGGSDAAAVVGLSPYKTPLDVYLDKTGAAPDVEENERMLWGNLLEDVVAQEYARRNDVKIRRRGMLVADNGYMSANIDRMILNDPRGPGILEVKTADRFMADQYGEEGTDQVPEYYHLQVTHYLAVTGYQWARLVVLIGGNDMRSYNIPRDDELIEHLIAVEGKFWHEHVVAGVAPDAQTSADLAKLYPRDNGIEVQASGEIEDAVKAIKVLQEQGRKIYKTIDDYKDQVRAFMGEASTLLDLNGLPIATWKAQTSRRLDVKAARQALGDEAKVYETESTTRVFRAK